MPEPEPFPAAGHMERKRLQADLSGMEAILNPRGLNIDHREITATSATFQSRLLSSRQVGSVELIDNLRGRRAAWLPLAISSIGTSKRLIH